MATQSLSETSISEDLYNENSILGYQSGLVSGNFNPDKQKQEDDEQEQKDALALLIDEEQSSDGDETLIAKINTPPLAASTPQKKVQEEEDSSDDDDDADATLELSEDLLQPAPVVVSTNQQMKTSEPFRLVVRRLMIYNPMENRLVNVALLDPKQEPNRIPVSVQKQPIFQDYLSLWAKVLDDQNVLRQVRFQTTDADKFRADFLASNNSKRRLNRQQANIFDLFYYFWIRGAFHNVEKSDKLEAVFAHAGVDLYRKRLSEYYYTNNEKESAAQEHYISALEHVYSGRNFNPSSRSGDDNNDDDDINFRALGREGLVARCPLLLSRNQRLRYYREDQTGTLSGEDRELLLQYGELRDNNRDRDLLIAEMRDLMSNVIVAPTEGDIRSGDSDYRIDVEAFVVQSYLVLLTYTKLMQQILNPEVREEVSVPTLEKKQKEDLVARWVTAERELRSMNNAPGRLVNLQSLYIKADSMERAFRIRHYSNYVNRKEDDTLNRHQNTKREIQQSLDTLRIYTVSFTHNGTPKHQDIELYKVTENTTYEQLRQALQSLYVVIFRRNHIFNHAYREIIEDLVYSWFHYGAFSLFAKPKEPLFNSSGYDCDIEDSSYRLGEKYVRSLSSFAQTADLSGFKLFDEPSPLNLNTTSRGSIVKSETSLLLNKVTEGIKGQEVKSIIEGRKLASITGFMADGENALFARLPDKSSANYIPQKPSTYLLDNVIIRANENLNERYSVRFYNLIKNKLGGRDWFSSASTHPSYGPLHSYILAMECERVLYFDRTQGRKKPKYLRDLLKITFLERDDKTNIAKSVLFYEDFIQMCGTLFFTKNIYEYMNLERLINYANFQASQEIELCEELHYTTLY
jgi:hypothetical protein